MPWFQREITLAARPRGVHLVTAEIVDALPELGELNIGLAHLFIRHTSASLTLNENASPDVRRDFETWFERRGPRGVRLDAHARGPRRHARARQGRAHGLVAEPADRRAAGSRSAPGRGSISASTATAAAPRSLLATLNGEYRR